MSGLRLFAAGPIADLDAEVLGRLFDRRPIDEPDVRADVAGLIADVRDRGDAALLDAVERFDGARLDAFEIPLDRAAAALDALDSELRRALKRAADNIRAFHEAQRPADVRLEVEPGVVVERRWSALATAGVYAPGGRAAYPSSVLMGAVPARAAGVGTVVLCSPPGPDGSPPQAVLAAAALAGVDRIFAVGGASAIGALAYGTESIPRTDVIVGPGNRWVTEAKSQVAGEVAVDSPAGPSEVLVVCDGGADPDLVAAEMVAQAEHDPDACAVAVTTDERHAAAIREALAGAVEATPRREVVEAALAAQGAILVATDVEAAFDFANRYGAEHASVLTSDASADAARLTTAGTVFVGPWSSVAHGDYLTGANHVLPTAGRSRSFSGLSTVHFLRSYTVQRVTADAAEALAEDVDRLARAEGLPGHAAAALRRATS